MHVDHSDNGKKVKGLNFNNLKNLPLYVLKLQLQLTAVPQRVLKKKKRSFLRRTSNAMRDERWEMRGAMRLNYL